MQDIVCFMHRLSHSFKVGDASFDKGDLAPNLGQVFFSAGGEVVQNDHAVPAANEFVHGIRTDKAGAACHYVTHCENSRMLLDCMAAASYLFRS